jgi:hypothetical protein
LAYVIASPKSDQIATPHFSPITQGKTNLNRPYQRFPAPDQPGGEKACHHKGSRNFVRLFQLGSFQHFPFSERFRPFGFVPHIPGNAARPLDPAGAT